MRGKAKGGDHWTAAEDRRLILMKRDMASYKEISSAIGRTPGGVARRWTVLRKQNAEAAAVQVVCGKQRGCHRPQGSHYGWKGGACTPEPQAVQSRYTDAEGRTVTVLKPGYAQGIKPGLSARPSNN